MYIILLTHYFLSYYEYTDTDWESIYRFTHQKDS